ncbi:MAG: TonB-dependent receptor [bacterium]
MSFRKFMICAVCAFLALFAGTSLHAQASASGRAIVRGQVTDNTGHALQGVTLVIDQRHAGLSDASGQFVISDLAPGRHMVRARFLGFAADSVTAIASESGGEQALIKLQPSATSLTAVRVEATRLTGQALSLNRQKTAEHIISVSTNEEITALPNANAADAFSRLPSVSLQRHEGEGSSVQVRGIDANLNNVMLNGAHLGGKSEDNPGGDRRVYMDGIPAGLVGAVQLNKTLTPDMDADAIGGTLAIETLSADAAPGVRVQYSYGQSNLQNAPVWLGSASAGMRFNRNAALFLGYTLDHNGRVYDDVEPSYARIKLPTGDSATIPTATSAREYFTDRLRQGATARLDWRPSDNTTLAVTGVLGNFHDYAVRYRQDHTLTTSSITPADALHGSAATGMIATSNVQNRTPTDRTRMLGTRGTTLFGANVLDYNATYSFDQFRRVDARDLTFQQKGLGGTYDWSSPLYPTITPNGTYSDATKFAFKSLKVSNPEDAKGNDYGASASLTMPIAFGDYSGSLKIGGKFRYEDKSYDPQILSYVVAPGQSFTLANVMGGFTNAGMYSGHYPIGLSPDERLSETYVATNPVLVVDPATVIAAKLATFTGHEQIAAGYASYSLDIDQAHLLFGVRAEATTTSYNSFGSVPGSATATQPVNGGRSYVNFFPNAQLRYALDDQTNLRVALTTSMARPLYSDLAPTVTLTNGALPTDRNAISAGNPNLKPMTSVNQDVMLEHFMPGVGLLAAGVFAKQISNYIYSESFTYVGAPYDGYNGARPTNATSGTLAGVEAAWQQRFTFLPAGFDGLGLDANGTWTHSNTSTPTRPSMNLPAQAKWNYNIAATYAYDRLTARITTQYNGEYVHVVGDGTTSPTSGDKYMLPHTQVDASLNLAVSGSMQVVLQGLNLNNAPFGYYVGTPQAITQRELYGSTATLALRYRL